MTPAELDYFRAKLLEDDPHLRAIVCAAPLERDFSAHPPEAAASLAKLQERFIELRHRFVTARSRNVLLKLAGRQPCEPGEFVQPLRRLDHTLSKAATGWRGHNGTLHAFAVDNPELERDDECPHGTPFGVECDRCAADDREAAAL